MTTTPIRFKITDLVSENIRFLVISNGKVSLVTSGDVPLALSYITAHAAELRFALEDAGSIKNAHAALKKYGYKSQSYFPL